MGYKTQHGVLRIFYLYLVFLDDQNCSLAICALRPANFADLRGVEIIIPLKTNKINLAQFLYLLCVDTTIQGTKCTFNS
jgi:hypothetical protein